LMLKVQYRNTVNPMSPSPVGNVRVLLTESKSGTFSMHRIGFIAHLMINENHHHARCFHLYIKQLFIHTMSNAFILWSVRGWVITSVFRERAFTFSIKFLWIVTYNGPYGDASAKRDLFQASGIRKGREVEYVLVLWYSYLKDSAFTAVKS